GMRMPIKIVTGNSPNVTAYPTKKRETDGAPWSAREARHADATRLLSIPGRPRSAAKRAANVAAGWPGGWRIALFAAAMDGPGRRICGEPPQTRTDPGKHTRNT